MSFPDMYAAYSRSFNLEKMELIVYQQERYLQESLANFLDLYYSSQMKYLASDLLSEGLSPVDITDAIRRAMTACKTAELEMRQHFAPFYTQQLNGVLIKDCKLSRLGYGLVMLNANVHVPAVVKWQLKALSKCF